MKNYGTSSANRSRHDSGMKTDQSESLFSSPSLTLIPSLQAAPTLSNDEIIAKIHRPPRKNAQLAHRKAIDELRLPFHFSELERDVIARVNGVRLAWVPLAAVKFKVQVRPG